MTTVVLLATAWGPKAGGINTFNLDLAAGLSAVLSEQERVICVVPAADAAAIRNADQNGVTLVSLELHRDKLPESFDVGWTDRVKNKLRDGGIKTVDLYVGHDVVSGEAANALRDETADARAVVLMHMSYSDYQSIKHGSGQEGQAKHEYQVPVPRRPYDISIDRRPNVVLSARPTPSALTLTTQNFAPGKRVVRSGERTAMSLARVTRSAPRRQPRSRTLDSAEPLERDIDDS